jgi:serine/threonine protein phosphatase PrpC
VNLTIGTVQRPCEGETACGDGFSTELLESGLLVSVVDGLGHGPHAEEAAIAFLDHVASDTSRSLIDIMASAREQLSSTRGAAAALLRFNFEARRVEFTGVGNIAMHSVADVAMHPVSAPGIVGKPVRKLLPFQFDLPGSALVALCSDGISSRLRLEEFEGLDVQAIAEAILELHGKYYDDATCVVVRYSGEE